MSIKSYKVDLGNFKEFFIIKNTVMSEKAIKLNSKKYNTIALIVDINANKHTIKLAVKKIFGVTPLSVRVLTYKPKKKMSARSRHDYYEPAFKKAYISLKEEDFKKNQELINSGNEIEPVIENSHGEADFSRVKA